MAQVPIEELLKQCGSIYRLVILAAKRAKELAEGAPPLVESASRKPTSVALEEILHGKVLYKGGGGPERPVKKSRSARTRGEQKKRVAA